MSSRFNKNSSGFTDKAQRFLIAASVTLSITTLFLSWKFISNDEARKGLHILGTLTSDTRTEVRDFGKNNGVVAYEKWMRELFNKEALEKSKPAQSPSKFIPKARLVPANQNKAKIASETYQPDLKKGKRLLTYKRFGGRLNNQLFQFITALQHAKVLRRTLVVPDEIREVDWTGMFDTGFGIWDIESLNKIFDIDWETGLSPEFSTPDECLMHWSDAPKLLNGGPSHWEKWDEKCPDIINIAGNTGLLFCERQHQFCGDASAQREAYNIYLHLKLSPEILEYIPSKSEEFKNQGFDKMAIHSRRAGEGGYDWEVCIHGNKKTCNHHLDHNEGKKFCDARTIKGNCAIWMDLNYQVKSKSALEHNEKDYRFVLASDGTHDWSIDFYGQFVTANNTEWLLALERRANEEVRKGKSLEAAIAKSRFVKDRLKNQKDLSRIRGTLDAMTATLLDLFSLVDSKYLLGAYYSTLSLNACYFRGVDRMYDSNMCWMLMHPDTEHAIPPPTESTANIGDGESNHFPAALMSDVEHAFIRSKDGNFVAIDRYRIPYQKAENNKSRGDVLAVLGDGLVPLTIEKNQDGKETVRADFSCSMGDQIDTLATVVLMKGNKSQYDHYYLQGEKYRTPFSTNGDRFRTVIILCEELHFDKSLSRHPPLILKSKDESFYISIGSSFAKPMSEPRTGRYAEKAAEEVVELVHCLNPAYGLKDPRWIIEYLEYHRAISITHVHVYNVDMHSPVIQAVLQVYRDQNFITRHDWSSKASGDYTTRITYEHAKWAAQTDCALRSRGQYDYALFSDIDEVVKAGRMETNASSRYPVGHIHPAIALCEAANTRGKTGCSFNSNTVTSVYTKLIKEEESSMKDKLMLERYDRVEASPHCPSNCACIGRDCKNITRKYHQGRQKYMINVRDSSIQPRVLWTHAISRDYNEMDEIMEVLPDDLIHIRHYQGHWYANNGLINTMEEIESPLSPYMMDAVRKAILNSEELNQIYTKAKLAAVQTSSSGLEWIKTMDRPEKYHGNVRN